MGLSKSFQLVLLLTFGTLLYLLFQNENIQVQQKGQTVLDEYKSRITYFRNWKATGDELYDVLSKEFVFQFFQFVHDSDSGYNFTHGSLANTDDDIASKLFTIELTHTQKLPKGRLQIKLNDKKLILEDYEGFERTALIIITVYSALMLLFAFLVFLHSRSLKYAAKYINEIPSLSFQAVKLSRFPGMLKPMGKALEACRSQLKNSLEVVRQENEQLTKAAYQDPVTNFSTRQRFTAHLDQLCQSSQSYGVICVVKAAELASINQLYGRTAGDDYLSKIANCIRKSSSSIGANEKYRISSGDFAIIFEGVGIKEGQRYLENLKREFDEYSLTAKLDSIAHSGLVPFKDNNDSQILMVMADTAVSIAQTLGPNQFHVLEKLTGNEQQGDDHWKITINDVINRDGLTFYQQPIQPCTKDVTIYRELLSRFHNSEGKNLPTTTVIAMSERYGLNIDLDKMVVINTIKLLTENKTLDGQYGVNISASSALQISFTLWLRDVLAKHQNIASRLIFEVNESGMQTNLTASQNFVTEVHSVGAKVAIERFGLGFTSFKFFREVRPDFIKLDSSYSDQIELDNNNKFFVRMIIDISKRIGIRVIATGVERQDEKLTLEKILVDGLQGYYIAQPEPVLKTID